MLKKIKKWMKAAVPTLLIIGWVTAREFGYGWHYFFVVTGWILVVWRKDLWEATKAWSKYWEWKIDEQNEKYFNKRKNKGVKNDVEGREGECDGNSVQPTTPAETNK